MMKKWTPTAHKGLRYYEHSTRRCGKRLDRYYAIRFRRDGKLYEYGVGWWSDGVPAEIRQADPFIGFEEYAVSQLKIYKSSVRDGTGPKSPQEKRKIAASIEARELEEQVRQAAEATTFQEIFEKKYFPVSKGNKKKGSWSTEQSLFTLWIEPTIGALPLKDISPIHLERIKKIMADARKTPRTIAYALSLIRQVYNFTIGAGVYSGACPVKRVKIPKRDNRRQRYLRHKEADKLLEKIKAISPDVHDMALLSLNCGLRAGEIFSLTWSDIDLKKKTLFIRDPKNKRNRHAYMTEAVQAILSARDGERPATKKPSDTLFATSKGNPVSRISKTFDRAVMSMELNQDITDPRQRVVFHSLRHTYASWLVESGVSLYTVQKLLGHENISMTERYSHLSPDTLQDAVRSLEKGIDQAKKKPEETEQPVEAATQ